MGTDCILLSFWLSMTVQEEDGQVLEVLKGLSCS